MEFIRPKLPFMDQIRINLCLLR